MGWARHRILSKLDSVIHDRSSIARRIFGTSAVGYHRHRTLSWKPVGARLASRAPRVSAATAAPRAVLRVPRGLNAEYGYSGFQPISFRRNAERLRRFPDAASDRGAA